MRTHLLFLFFLITISGCKKDQSNDSRDFTSFLEKFSTEKDYQLSKIDFPLPYYSYDIMDELDQFMIEKNEWEYIPFHEDKYAKERAVDSYEVVIKEGDKNEMIYSREGIDNGINIEYHFHNEDESGWSLVKIIDRSN